MSRSYLQRTTAWLCLVIALLSGITPAQGLVLCIERDGCVSFEVKAFDANCAGCDGHEADKALSSVAAQATSDAGCPCIDLGVPDTTQDQGLLPGATAFRIGAWIALPLEIFPHLIGSAADTLRATAAEVPRSPESLALIRTVVLLV